MDRGAWQATVHGPTKSQTWQWLSMCTRQKTKVTFEIQMLAIWRNCFPRELNIYFHMKSWLHMKSCPFIRVCSNLPNGILNSLWESQLAEAFIRERNVSYSIVSDSATPRTVAHRAPLSMGFSRQEYWSELLFSSPGDLPDPGIKTWSPALQADSLPSEPPRKPIAYDTWWLLIFT